jgi:hypothetical protein
MAVETQIKLYTGTRKIGESRFVVHIPATSWAEATSLFDRIGAVLDGELVEEQATNVCCICAGTISKDFTHLEPTNGLWDDTIDE